MYHPFRHPNVRKGSARWGPRLPGFADIFLTRISQGFHHPNVRNGSARWGPRFALG